MCTIGLTQCPELKIFLTSSPLPPHTRVQLPYPVLTQIDECDHIKNKSHKPKYSEPMNKER